MRVKNRTYLVEVRAFFQVRASVGVVSGGFFVGFRRLENVPEILFFFGPWCHPPFVLHTGPQVRDGRFCGSYTAVTVGCSWL